MPKAKGEIKTGKQLTLEFSSNNELILTESRSMRDELVFKDTVLDKVKFLALIDGTVEVSIEMAAAYYEVPASTIESAIKRNRDEFNEYGEVRVLKGKNLSEFKTLVQDEGAYKGVSSLTLITRRGMLRIGMLLTQSDIAKSVRSYLLNIEEISSEEQKMWALEREISKRERRRLTDSIQSFYNGSLKNNRGLEYAMFTNLVYEVLWDMDAASMRDVYGLEKREPLRDSLSTEDLRKVVDVETAIAAFIRTKREYSEIRTELLNSKDSFR